jgi:raffinose/stachyose/melibiose transport system substrate-binding protein
MDLTDAYKEYGWDQRIPQSLIDHVTIDGKIYAVPQSVETVGLFYNITLFEQLGLSVPTTFDEYMAVLQALKDAGYYGYAIGLAGGWPSAFMASEFMYLSAGTEYAKVLSGEIPWTESPQSLQGLTAFHEIVAGGYSNPDVLGIDQDQANDLFFQGQTATTLNTNGWIGSVLIAKPEFETGFFYLPPIDPATDVKSLGGIGGSLIVTKSTPNPDAALQVIDWLLAPEQVRTVFTGAGDIPPVDFELPEDTDPLLRQIATETIANAGNVGFWPVTYLAPQVFSQLNALVQGMMGGQLTPEQVLEEMQKAHETYVKEKGA